MDQDLFYADLQTDPPPASPIRLLDLMGVFSVYTRWTRYNTAHLFNQLAEGNRSARADTRRGTEVKMAFLQENEMA